MREVIMDRRNITLSLPEDVLTAARHLAVERGTSLSGMLADFLRQMVDQHAARRRAQQRIEERLAAGFDLGTEGEIGWSRDELHER
jgi:hypothetical protein